MYNTVIGVGAAVLVGGVALYAGYQMTQREAPATETEVVDRRVDEPREAERRARGTGRGGVPEGSEALDFAEGAAGDRVAPTTEARDAEARREADRLAALGSGGVLEDDAAARGADGHADRDDRRAPGPSERRADQARGGLRGALSEQAATGEPDGTKPDALTATASAPASSAALRGERATATVRNASLTDKPDVARNTPLVDKPDERLARLVDKPDNSPYFAATDAAPGFDPCVKADGTPYVGPGTAINPFADGDPCLPRATGQAFEVAQVVTRPGLVTGSDLGDRGLRVLPFVDLVQPGFIAAPPVGTDFGSDYRR